MYKQTNISTSDLAHADKHNCVMEMINFQLQPKDIDYYINWIANIVQDQDDDFRFARRMLHQLKRPTYYI